MQYLSVGVLATFFTMPSNPSKTKRQIFLPNRPERRCSVGSPSLAARKPTISLRQIEKVCFLEPEVKIHPHPRLNILLPVKAARSFCDAFVEFLLDLLVKIRQTYKDFKHLDPDVQQQILFSISTLIGTVVFYFIFECVHFFIKLQIFIFPRISAPSYTFGIAYSLSYLISVVYQHGNVCGQFCILHICELWIDILFLLLKIVFARACYRLTSFMVFRLWGPA